MLLLMATSAFAQSCSQAELINLKLTGQSEPQKTEFVRQLQHTNNPFEIYRWAAIAEWRIIPILRTLSKPAMPVNSSSGEAQVSLAKLGDKNSLSELDQELNHSADSRHAVAKLLRVGNDRAVALLMGFLQQHISDNSLHHVWSDYDADIRWDIIRGLGEIVLNPPLEPHSGSISSSYDAWMHWWKQAKETGATISISSELQEPYLACLARKVEWGFPEAILDMANTGNPQAISILRVLEHAGRPIYTLNTTRGRAEFALAKLGDEEAFQSMEQGVKNHGSSIVIDMLHRIGGKRAVNALVDALDSDFPRDFATGGDLHGKLHADYIKEADRSIISVLTEMVADPPRMRGNLAHQKNQWKDWWASNQDTAQFVAPPSKNYE